MRYSSKKGAIELSMGTVIIIVLGVTMLILGMVLVRAIMCSALGLTGNVNDKIESELDRYFEARGDEVVCIGETDEASMTPGERNFIWCTVNAPVETEYQFSVKSYIPLSEGIDQSDIEGWIVKEKDSFNVAPGDKKARSPVIFNVPKDAAEGSFEIQLEVKKKDRDGSLKTVSNIPIHFKVTRVGFVKATMC